jgi:hypothetical protein
MPDSDEQGSARAPRLGTPGGTPPLTKTMERRRTTTGSRSSSAGSNAASVVHSFRRISAMFILLATGVVACAHAPTGDFCETRKTNMNQVVWTPGFDDAIDAFFGRERASFYWEGGRVFEQVAAGLGGPPYDLERLPGGLMMGSACRWQSCPERAAIVQCPSTIVAVGVKHWWAGERNLSFDSVPTFTIYSAPGAPAVARERLEAWARSESADRGGAVSIEHRAPRGRGAARPRR